jgi:hypothetical protein
MWLKGWFPLAFVSRGICVVATITRAGVNAKGYEQTNQQMYANG